MTLSPRLTFFSTALLCAALLGYGYYLEYVEFLDPCNLCKLQRVAFMAVILFAMIGMVHGSTGAASRVYHLLIALSATAGAALAGRQVWLQGLPPEDVPECSPGLEFMLESSPWLDVFREVLTGSGSCAEIDWSFLGLSIAGWALAWFAVIVLANLIWAIKGYRRAY